MNTITLPQKAFKAVELAMTVKDIRYYLCGVMIEHNGEETRLAATDGHRLHIVRVNHPSSLVIKPFQVILPATMVKTICKAKAGRGCNPDITLTIDGTKASALLPDCTEIVATLIDGTFPDYTRVIPDSFSGEPAQYNTDYVSDAMKSAGYWIEQKAWQYCATFVHGGSSIGGIALPNFVAVVMPTRVSNEHFEIDTSFKLPLRAPELPKKVAA